MVDCQNIVIFTDDPGWHGRKLCTALSARGYQGHFRSLTDCGISLDTSSPTLLIPGFEQCLPDGVFVRGVPGGSLEQVIFRLNILHILQDMGIAVMNDGRAIERTVDKSMTSYLLLRAGIPTPSTYVFESLEQAYHLLEKGTEWVIKPLFGSQGIGVQKLSTEILENHPQTTQGLFYIQEFIDRPNKDWQDIRVLVVQGQAKYAMLRKGQSWITNRTQGAECMPVVLDNRLRTLAEETARALDIDYCGIDLIYDRDDQPLVLEVNSIPAWWGLQQTVSEDIAIVLIDALLMKIKQQASHTTQGILTPKD